MKTFLEIFTEKYGPEVKAREGNNIRLMCPKCAHKSLSCNISNGLMNCFHCSYGKGIRVEGASSGFKETPTDYKTHLEVTLKVLEVSTLLPDQRKYLASRSIYNPDKYLIKSAPFRIDKILLEHFTRDQLISSGYFYESYNELVISSSLEPRRMLIPFWCGDAIIGLTSRSRPLADSTSKRYLRPKGSKIKDELFYRDIDAKDIIITEGELAVLAALDSGIKAIGYPGLSNVCSQKTKDRLKYLTADADRIFIILDSDENIYNDREKLKHSLALYNTFDNGCIVYLDQDKSDEKMDLDLFLSRNHLNDFYNTLEDRWGARKTIFENISSIVNGTENKNNDKINSK